MKKGDRIGDYLVVDLIGVGGQAEVALAECVTEKNTRVPKGTHVALKKFYYQAQSERSIDMFMARARLLLEFDHPNLIHYFGFFMHGEDRPEKCLVMEYIDGETMRDWLIRWNAESQEPGTPLKGFSWEDASSCILNVIEGLIYARNCGFTHRDIKPDNIVISKDGNVKVLDFDIARMAEDKRTHGSRSANLQPIAYMAPEFLDTAFTGDEQSDILSLGVTLFEAMCGDTYCEQNESGIFGLALDQPALDDYVFPGIQALLRKAIEPSRQKRYQTLEEFRDGIKKITRRSIAGQRTYRLLTFIKQGGFGAVYKAECVQTGEHVAIKKLSPPKLSKLVDADHRRKFKHEAEVLWHTNHPHIVRYLEAIDMDTDSDPFLVMEYLPGMPGMSLKERIKKHGKLPAVHTASLFISYLDALHHLHTNGIIHRDISPDNLYAPDDPRSARIFDLGVARNAKATMTSGKLATKLQYAAPEFHRERGSAMTDVYSLALCMYEALTGNAAYPLPGNQEKALELFRDRMMNPKKFTLDIDGCQEICRYPELKTILEQACHPEAHKRFQSAAAMKARLMKFVRNHSTLAGNDQATMTGAGLTSMTRMPDEETETVAAGETVMENINIPDEDDQKKAEDEARRYERKIFWQQMARRLGKAAIVLLVTGMIAAGSWTGPSYIQRSRMQRYMDGYSPAPDAASVRELADRYAACGKRAQKDRLPNSPWPEWKQWTEKKLTDMPSVFSTALSNTPERLDILAENWRQTEPVWKSDDLKEKHVSKWMRLMALMDFALYVKDLQNGNHETPDELNSKIEEFSLLQGRYASVESPAEQPASDARSNAIKNYYQKVVNQAEKTSADDLLLYKEKRAELDELKAKIRSIKTSSVDQRRPYEQQIERIADDMVSPPEGPTPDQITASISTINAETDKIRKTAGNELRPDDLRRALQVLINNSNTASYNGEVKGTAAIRDFKTLFIEKGTALLRSSDAPEQRLSRLQAMQMLTNSTDFIGTFDMDERGDLPGEMTNQMQRFVLALENKSDISAALEAPHLQDGGLLPPNTNSVFVFSGITNTIQAKLVVTPRNPHYQPVSLDVELLPGSGAATAIATFEPKPVTIKIINNALTPPVKAEYQINEGGWITTVAAQTINHIVPPAKIDVRFERTGYLPARIEASRNVAIGASEFDIPSPAVTEWSKIPDEIPWEKTLEKTLSETKLLFEQAETLIREDLAWAFQITGLNTNKTAREPNKANLFAQLRISQPPPPNAWEPLRNPLTSAEQELKALSDQAGEASRTKSQELLSKINYYLLWAENRDSDPRSKTFLQKLAAYKGVAETETGHAVFAHAVLSNPADRSSVRNAGIGFEDLDHWRAHQDSESFDDPSSTIERLRCLGRFFRNQSHVPNQYDIRLGLLLAYMNWYRVINAAINGHEMRLARGGASATGNFKLSNADLPDLKESVNLIKRLLELAPEKEKTDAIHHFEQLAASSANTDPGKASIVLLSVITTNTYPDQIAGMDPKYQTIKSEMKKLF